MRNFQDTFETRRWAWCKSTTKTPGHWTRDPCQSLKMEPGTPSKFKSGTLVIIFFYCFTYFVLEKYIYIYIYNTELIFHE